MITRRDFKNPWTYLWIIATLLLYWFVLYHVLKPTGYLILGDVKSSKEYPLLFVHNFWILFSHIAASIVVAILLPWQFLIFKVKKIRAIHKPSGYVCLVATFFAAPTAIYLSYASNGPFLTETGNALAAVGWCIAFWVSYCYIRKGNIIKHQRWMIRTYAFFLDGAVLRLIYTELEIFSKAGSKEYNEEAWLSWLLTWAIVETLFLIERFVKKKN